MHEIEQAFYGGYCVGSSSLQKFCLTSASIQYLLHSNHESMTLAELNLLSLHLYNLVYVMISVLDRMLNERAFHPLILWSWCFHFLSYYLTIVWPTL